MSVSDCLLRECEVLDWWNAERLRVDEACRSALERYVERACVAVDELSTYQMLHNSDARLHVERKLQSDINVFNRRMELQLRNSCELSMAKNLRPDQFNSIEFRETAALMASGAAAVGAVGAAVAATGLATTTTVTSVLGVFATGTIATFSWPLFSTAAAVAILASVASPKIRDWATSKLRGRYKVHLRNMAEKALVGRSGQSALEILLKSLDAARDARLADLEH